jgi:beta-N-acetylhexosaminidase
MVQSASSIKRVLLTILIFTTISGIDRVWSIPHFFNSPESADRENSVQEHADQILATMDDAELLGQVFILGYFGRSPSAQILEWIKNRHIGGVKIFGWNAENLQELGRSIEIMQTAATESRLQIPLFVATDQEGGWVRHVKGDTSITPGNLAIGATKLPYDAYHTGAYIGKELRSLGINMNFAPTVDIYGNENAHVIGPRAFAEDPVTTAQLAVAYYHGMEDSGIICTAKHFPGHGKADEDSHGTLPVISSNFATIWEEDLLPYRFLFREGLPAIMSAHLSFPSIIDKTTPASLSPFFLREVVREKMGFEGIVITDDLRMHGALQSGNSISAASLQALKAGNDMIMISHDFNIYNRVWAMLYTELQNNPQFRDQLRDSVRRILITKLRYLKGPDAVPLKPDSAEISRTIPAQEGQEFFFNQACRSVSLIQDGNIPLDGENQDILIAGQLRTFLNVGRRYYPEAGSYYFPYSPFYEAEEQYISELKSLASRYDTLIYCLANPNSAEVLRQLQVIDIKIIVISVLTPVYLRSIPWIGTGLAVYGTGEDSFIAGFAALKGMIPAEGVVPIRMQLKESPSP